MDAPQPVNLADALATFEDVYSPRIVAQVNDYAVKIAHVAGPHMWHSHEDSDEFFLVLDGHFEVAMRGADGTIEEVTLHAGDTFVVPRGVEHKPSSSGGSILMFEPSGTVSTGDAPDIPTHLQSTTGHEL